MPFQCDEFEYCKVNVQYVADSNLVKEKREEVINSLKKMKVKLPGFRKGKASDTALKQTLKKHIHDALLRDLVAHAYDDIIFETKMKPIGYPQIVNHDLYGDRFSCELVFLKKPKFDLNGYKDLEIPKPHINLDLTAESEKMMQELREHHADVVPYGDGDFIQKGDQVIVDVDALIDDQKVDKLSMQGYNYEVGSNTIVTEFDENLFGMSPGDVREFNVKFGNEVGEFSNKEVKFTVKFHMGTKKSLPALDDEFAKKLNYENTDKLRETVTAAAAKKLNAQMQQQIQRQITLRLLENNKFEVPEWLVSQEVQMRTAGFDMSTLSAEIKEKIVKDCEDSVRLALIMDEIREKEPEAFISNDEVIRVLKSQLKEHGQDADLIIKQKQKDGSLHGWIAGMMNEFTMQWILSNSKIVE